MGHRIWHMMGVHKLACLGGMLFAVIMFRCFEFPYGDVISVLFSVSKTHITKTASYPPENSSLINSTGDGYSTNSSTNNVSNSVETIRKHDTSTRGVLPFVNVSSVIEVPCKKKKGNVVSISEMHDILVQYRASSHSMEPRWPSKADQELLEAKLQIENASFLDDHNLYPSVFRNVSVFRRSYELMEKNLKVYIYKEGERPIFHQPEAVLKGIYASEGWFMMQMKASKRFITNKPKRAHLFYIPYSSKMLKATLSPNSYDRESVVPYLKKYLDMIAGRYSFWNRTGGADHFLVACHDWVAICF